MDSIVHFNKLLINDFRQFHNIELILGQYVTAIGGFNGTGKSTILGLLANSSELKGYKTYFGKSFKGEFSELFRASRKNDPSGSVVTLEYGDFENPKIVTFRTAWQSQKVNRNGKWVKTGERFRVIPKRKNEEGRVVESKLPSPVIYLGLSRLYPIGEAKYTAVKKQPHKWDNPEDKQWFEEQYKSILFMTKKVSSISRLGVTGISRKAGVGISTDRYDELVNSSGQDNVGQILLAVASFRKLKRELADKWDGGLLLIDEIDATLHGAAQLRLIDFLIKEGKKIGFQTIFTTHSPTILEHLSAKCAHNPIDFSGNIEINYLTDANDSLKVLRNPTWPQMESDLLARSGAATAVRVGVFSEDAEAIWFANGIVSELDPAVLNKVSFIDASFGNDALIHLYIHDFPYLKNRIVLFDGDVTEEKLKEKIPANLLQAGANISILPGGQSPEKVIYEYLCNLEPESSLLEDLIVYGVSKRVLRNDGPMSSAYEGDERNRYKSWFRAHQTTFDAAGVLLHWIKDNFEEARDFASRFRDAYNAIAKRTSAVEVSTPKTI